MRSFVIPPRTNHYGRDKVYHVWDSDVGGTLCGHHQMTGWKVVFDTTGFRECVRCGQSKIRAIVKKENNDSAS